MWAIVGLGNPGRKYTHTRHNVGYKFIINLAKHWGTRVRKRSFLSKTASIERGDGRVLLVMPQTFMNKSGQAVKRMVDDSKFRPEQMVIVFDDFDLPLGEIRVREEGTGGSHKGMNSIIQALDTTRIPRIRIGIGPVEDNMDAVDFVLSPFHRHENLLLEMGLSKAREALEYVLDGELQEAMNLYN